MRESASKSALLLSPCLRWAHPAAPWYSDRPEDAQAREEGTAFHHVMHLYEQGLPSSFPVTIRDKVRHAKAFLDQFRDRAEWIRTELVMGLDLKTRQVELLEGVTDRQYPEKPNMLYGSFDLVACLKNRALLVADWKTGDPGGAEAQLLTGLVMASAIFPSDSYRIATWQAGDEGVWDEEREVLPVELDAHYAAIRDAVAQARSTPKPSLPVVGMHCTQNYCPHLAKCPAHLTEMEGLYRASTKEGGPDTAITPVHWSESPSDAFHAGQMASRLRGIKRMTKYYEGYLKDYAREGNRVIYDGYEWKEGGGGFRWSKL